MAKTVTATPDNQKVAIVTGAARGIGREIARELLKMGMTVVAVDLKADLLGQLPEALGNPGDKLETRVQDVTDSAGMTAMVDAVAEKYGHLDVMVNNAGITRDNIVVMMTDEEWDLVLKVNLTSAFYGIRAASRVMMRQRCGSIVNMSSYSGLEGNRGQGNYAASKAGMLGLMKSAAKELAKRNVRVNAVAPGFIATEMTEVLPQQAKDMALAMIPMERMGTPGDIARAVAFLASENSAYMTGQVLSVDGGMHT
ncbi:MAG: 3-oxoacyl-[acyl-carrier-protein] reductase [Planctomycetaceae bacterium]|nr:3-oxoacyl-[acyl-carrier-protein] reductase [Planctomycetaceae bacterium]